MKTKVINLFAGPCGGKSVMAADLFSKLSKKGKQCELVREYVKDWAWQDRLIRPSDYLHLLGEQSYRESTLYGKVEYLITDSPLLLCSFYQKYRFDESYLTKVTQEFMLASKCEFHNFLIKRTTKYSPFGRYESESEIKTLDKKLKKWLDRHTIYTEISSAEEVIDFLKIT
jgi:hypothetical protein